MPDRKMRLPTFLAWGYAPSGVDALSVIVIVFGVWGLGFIYFEIFLLANFCPLISDLFK